MLSVGELSERKNQILVLQALSGIKSSYPEVFHGLQYLIVGNGDKLDDYQEYCENHGITEHVHFLGYRNDIPELLHASDLFVFPSLQEGLPVALMEALSSGIEVVCSKIRGNTDLINKGLFETDDVEKLEKLIIERISNRSKKKKTNHVTMNDYTVESVQRKMRQVYEGEL